jgi:hypothetical protein
LFARHGYAESEMGYRPKTVVTMRAETLPETVPAPEGTSTVQLASASNVSGSSTGGGATPAASVVTLTIPAMKIIIPMNAATANKGPTAVNGTPALTLLPPAGRTTASGNSTASSPVPAASPPLDKEVRTAAHTQVEPESSLHIASPSPPPEPVPDLKSASNSESPKRKTYDPLRPSKLSSLPPDPPEVPGKGSNSAASEVVMEVPPLPPAVPKKSSEGPSLPPVDPAPK